VETEPVVALGYFAKTDDEFVGLLGDFGCFHENVALSFGDGEDPVFAQVAKYFDLEAAIQETGSDILWWNCANIIEGDVDSMWGDIYFTNFF
jgi:hypothetical protein